MKHKNIILVIVLIVVIFASIFGIYIYSINSKSSKCNNVEFIVEPGNGLSKIINNLSEKDLIKSTIATKIYAKLNKIVVKAGTYNLNTCLSTKQILNNLENGNTINEDVRITFVEGKRVTDYVSLISDKLGINEDSIYEVLSDEDYLKSLIKKYDFLTDDILNNDIYYPLEGYLFPDTYFVFKDSDIKNVVEKMLDNLGKVLDNIDTSIKESKYSYHEILTIASIIENETIKDEDRSIVSGIIHNRLKKNMPLGMDVTTYYGVKKAFKEVLTQSDLDSKNGYNTRNNSFIGLPVGPISNPSIKSIEAALNPSKTDYLYFYADSEGNLHYSKTYSEHQNTVRKYS